MPREKLCKHCDFQHRLSTIRNRETDGLFARILRENLVNPRAALYPSMLDVDLFHMTWEDEDQSMPKEVQHLSLPDLDLIFAETSKQRRGSSPKLGHRFMDR
ncbi:hypothetical protein N7G274_004827 [Stereocaulon virgatum]|uniref:Uncharacterized protein n=1 Tax=Stereocaulon virgatum TaxID=373712 RepID=A0ABR4AG14_9LECA